ncbi:helix-turn-helix domain-containing protein [Sporosarcina sp. Te-1]|uniref:helix-turn-helix domain-containing protein n=1 Tax=Sporosarcina sp. Te-1 TaxID=2818390 RepID=UPI001A9F0A83|nr:helix-turn-helix domain-containing protein [Sporosarcina sp. Te-1]QTD42203.1 helix-turn-helix domain-containing protein [Sporosarcina sp. Te-1]
MELSSVILFMLSKMNGERSRNACLHIIRGKRSGQTLQDVQYFNLKAFFSILPKLNAAIYENELELLVKNRYIMEVDSRLYVTDEGYQRVKAMPPYHFNGWEYRGNDTVFFSRLTLAIQTLSYFKEGIKSFMPIQTDRDIQLFVKGMLRNLPIEDRQFSKQVGRELKMALNESSMSEVQKLLLTSRLTGHGITGRTWEQLAADIGQTTLSIYMDFIEGVHKLLEIVHRESSYPFLRNAAEGTQTSTYLTESAFQTRQLYVKGMTAEEISTARGLKQSTIEDHFVEMAINDETFPLHEFVTLELAEKVVSKVSELGTRRLRVLKQEFGELSYFQLRLILGAKLGGGK